MRAQAGVPYTSVGRIDRASPSRSTRIAMRGGSFVVASGSRWVRHVQRDPLGERGQHLGCQFSRLLEAVEASAWQIFQFATGQSGLPDFPERVAAAHDPVREGLADARVGAHRDHEAAGRVVDPAVGYHGLARDPDRLSVEPDVAVLAQRVDQTVHRFSGHGPTAPGPERTLDGDVPRCRDEGRAVDAPRRDGCESRLEYDSAGVLRVVQIGAGLGIGTRVGARDDLALEAKTAIRPREGVANASRRTAGAR